MVYPLWALALDSRQFLVLPRLDSLFHVELTEAWDGICRTTPFDVSLQLSNVSNGGVRVAGFTLR